MGRDTKNILYTQLGIAVVLLVMTAFAPALTVAGPVLIFGVVGLLGAMQKPRLLNIAKYYAYLAPFSVIVVMITTFFPFIGSKDYFFRFSVELALMFTVLWWAFEASPAEAQNRVKVLKKPLFIAVSLFVLVYLLSTAFAYDPNAAFWSNFERGEGGFQMIHYYIFFVVLAFLLDKEEDWLALMKVSVLAGLLMILYGFIADLGLVQGIVSIYGQPPAGLWTALTSGRFQGSLGNPAYVAPYLLFSLFYLFYLWASKPASNWLKYIAGGAILLLYLTFQKGFAPFAHNESAYLCLFGFLAFFLFYLWAADSDNNWLRGIAYGGMALVVLFFFIVSQTRGAFIGLGAGVFALFVYLLWSLKQSRRWLFPVSLACVAIVSGLIYFHSSDFVKKLPGSRIFELSFSDQTINTRLWTWGSAWEGFKERPILGWGPENFSAVFDKYFDPRHYVPGTETETWFDRAHSLYFDALSETGLLGFLAYFGIFALLFRKLAHSFRSGPSAVVEQKKDKSGNAYGAVVRKGLMIALPVAYLVQGLAIFDVLPIYINLFLFFALGVFYLNYNE